MHLYSSSVPNAKKDPKKFHLYEIYDTEDDDTYKYGISHYPIGDDGLSQRIREQVSLFNRVVKWARFIGRILLRDIPGRARAEEIEKKHISEYHQQHGQKPRGNL
ncbi:MAG: hypothetical protein ACKVU2_02495 [Saprospiraceae bacterium]